MLTRRRILQYMTLVGGLSLLPFGRQSWALSVPQTSNRHLIVILMRGAVDGLSLVVPYMEANYYLLRSSIALPPPNENNGLINLDGFFGLHPSLAQLMPLWENRSLAFIHASGSPAETRSHFEAQDILETAMLNTSLASDGWMNSLAKMLPDDRSPTRALSFGNILPRIFQGKYNIETVPTSLHPNENNLIENPELIDALNQMYAPHTELKALFKQGILARESMIQDLQKEMDNSARGAPAAEGFAEQTTKAADMIRRDPHIQLMFMDVGGWDTHVNQGNSKGQLANKLEKFSDGLCALTQGLGPAYQNTTILIMSEFGRTVAENGNGGTDHGHGNVAWVMGGIVKGGRVWGRWPGLENDQLFEKRDLTVTTDFRSVIGAVLAGHHDLNDKQIGKVIPDYVPDSSLRGLVS